MKNPEATRGDQRRPEATKAKRRALMLCLLTMCLLTVSCSNSSDSDPQNKIDPSVVGRWKWIKSSGGIAGITKYPEPDELTEIEFTANGRFHRYINHVAVGSATFTTRYEETIFGSEKRLVIRFDPPPEPFELLEQPGLVVYRSGNTLILSDNYVDGFGHRYTKN